MRSRQRIIARHKSRLTQSYEMGLWDGMQLNERVTFGDAHLYRLGYRHGLEARRRIFARLRK